MGDQALHLLNLLYMLLHLSLLGYLILLLEIQLLKLGHEFSVLLFHDSNLILHTLTFLAVSTLVYLLSLKLSFPLTPLSTTLTGQNLIWVFKHV